MQTVVIFEDSGYRNLLPLTYWRTCSELRIGYSTLLGHLLAHVSESTIHLYCRSELSAVTASRLSYPVNEALDDKEVLFINSRLLLDSSTKITSGQGVQWYDDSAVMFQVPRDRVNQFTPKLLLDPQRLKTTLADFPKHDFIADPKLICYPWDLVHANEQTLRDDWQAREVSASLPTPEGVHVINPDAIHIATSDRISPGVVLDADAGPIYIDEGVTVSALASIQGPCYLGPNVLIQPNAVIRGGVSIGQRCKVGGEVEGSILHAFSNKQHDGFLGHAYIAEWVNLGAGTIVSDLKNTYGSIRVPINGREVDSGRMFVGPTLGDFCKTGIGQLLPTGAVLGTGSMVATGGFSPKFVPSFSWMTASETQPHDPQRALEVATKMMARRDMEPTSAERELFLKMSQIAARHEVR